jgi:hypothetical protein
MKLSALGEDRIFLMATSSQIERQPPLLVQRCNGTTAGLGHLEVVGMPMHKFILRQ